MAAKADWELRFQEDSGQSGTSRQRYCREAGAEYQYMRLHFLSHFAEEFRSFLYLMSCDKRQREAETSG